jgi:hypothetical protein
MLRSVDATSNIILLFGENLQCLQRDINPHATSIDDNWRIVDIYSIDDIIPFIQLEVSEHYCSHCAISALRTSISTADIAIEDIIRRSRDLSDGMCLDWIYIPSVVENNMQGRHT